jgi:primase-polymerase (primpol)-like protein
VSAHRNPVPKAMVSADRWVRRNTAKVPLTTSGAFASSIDPRTWSTYADANASTAGNGLGFMLGDGFACIDLDHCLVGGVPTAAAATFLENYPEHHIEISPSGDGLHIWGTAEPAPGDVTTQPDGLRVERYTRERYITVTGNVYQRGELLPI